MNIRWVSALALVMTAWLAAAANPPAQTVEITGAVRKPITLTADDLAKMP